MTKALLAVLAGAAIIAAGCTSYTETVELEGPSDQGKAPMSSTDTNTAALAKCELCGNEVPSAELVIHDGKMACKACIESHGH